MTESIIVFTERARFKAENKVLIEHFQTLNQILFDTRNFYELWWTYLKLKSKKAYFPKFLQYKEFFETVGGACINGLVVNLFKLYDESKESYSIRHLINDLKENHILDSLDKDFIRINKKKSEKIWKKVKVLRHKLFAHRHRDLTIEEIYDIAKITPNNFRSMIDYTLKILNHIAPVLHESKKEFYKDARRDFFKLFRKLIEERRYK